MYSVSELLANTPLFNDLTEEELALFAAVCTERALASNAVLFNEGDDGSELFLVIDGRLEAYKPFIGKVNTFQPGDHFGEFSLLDDSPRSASVISATSSRVASLTRKGFTALCAQHPEMGYRIMQNIARELVARIKDHEQRAVDLLVRGQRL